MASSSKGCQAARSHIERDADISFIQPMDSADALLQHGRIPRRIAKARLPGRTDRRHADRLSDFRPWLIREAA